MAEYKAYTEEELQSIREKLKKAFDIDYIPVSNEIGRLFKDKKIKLEVGDVLHVHLPYGNDKFGLDKGWHRIKVTYIRSGVVFFRYMDTRKRNEDHADIDSYFIERAHLGNVRLKDVSINKKNLPLIKIEKENDPFPVSILDIDGKTVISI